MHAGRGINGLHSAGLLQAGTVLAALQAAKEPGVLPNPSEEIQGLQGLLVHGKAMISAACKE